MHHCLKSKITDKPYLIMLYRVHLTMKIELKIPKCNLPLNKILEIIPGKTINQRGRNFRYPASIVPAFAFDKFLAARALCTITCTEKLYIYFNQQNTTAYDMN